MIVDLLEEETQYFIICHLETRDHIKIRHIILRERESLSSHHYANFEAFRSCGNEDITLLFCQSRFCEHMI